MADDVFPLNQSGAEIQRLLNLMDNREELMAYFAGLKTTDTDPDQLMGNGWYFIQQNHIVDPELIGFGGGFIFNARGDFSDYTRVQLFVPLDVNKGIKYRTYTATNTRSPWTDILNRTDTNLITSGVAADAAVVGAYLNDTQIVSTLENPINYNEITTPGKYFNGTAESVSYTQNKPEGMTAPHKLYVIKHTSIQRISQIILSNTTNPGVRIYKRFGSRSGSAPNYTWSWSPWNEIMDYTTAIDATLTQSGKAAEAAETGRRISELEVDVDGVFSLPQLQYIISEDGKWQASDGRHISVTINGGDVVVFTANASYDGVCAFLKSDNAASGVIADFCADTGGETWTERKRVTKDTTVTYTAPSDCNILYVAAKPSRDHNLLPTKLIINGKDVTVDLREATNDHEDRIAALTANEKAAKSENLATCRNLDIWGIRSMIKGEFAPVSMPSEFSYLEGYDLPLYTDGYKYIHEIDLSAYKNNSTNIVTVHDNTEFQTVLTNATAGDTIILDGGCYASIIVDKSINLIGRNNPLFANYLPGRFTATTDETGKTFRSVADFGYSATMILDTTRLDDGIIIPMTQARSISACVSTPGSYIVSSNKLYVHMYEGKMPTERDIAVLGTDAHTIRLNGTTAACKWYLEGLIVFGGKSCISAIDSEDFGEQTVIGVDCKAYYSQTGDCIAMRGVDAFFQRCETMGAYLDGFNYHKRNPSDPTDHNISNGFEVDCIGHDNGHRDSRTLDKISDNGSTIHDGGKIVRINGLYYNNNGGNVADTNPDTVSYNYGCIALDSTGPQDSPSDVGADYWTDKSAIMYLYACRSLGDSIYSLRIANNSQIIADDKTEYDESKTKGFELVENEQSEG